MQKYDSYKDSGVQWIGEIPDHWEVMKLKYILRAEKYACKTGPFGTQLKGNDLQPEGDVRVYNQRNVIDDNFESVNFYISNQKAESLDSFYTQANDLLVTSRGTIGRCSILPNDVPMGILHPCLIALRIDESKCLTKWLKLFINESDAFATNIFLNSNATTIEVIYTDTIKNVDVTIPSISEQQKLLDYLDSKCSKIDHVIATQEKRVELLRELKQSIITRAVTRGITPDAKMKDTGNEWIGRVPENWEVVKIKYVINLLTDYDANGSFADIAKNCNINNGNPYAWMVRATDLENKRYGIVEGNNYCDLETYKYLKKSSLEANDLLLAKRGEIGKSYLVPECKDPMTLAPNTYLLKTKKEVINNLYFYYYLQSGPGHENLKTLNKSTTLGALYKDDVKAMSIPLPPISEQNSIVKWLTSEVTRMDKTITNALRQIELLKEYKQSLITEVVTGKRKVC